MIFISTLHYLTALSNAVHLSSYARSCHISTKAPKTILTNNGNNNNITIICCVPILFLLDTFAVCMFIHAPRTIWTYENKRHRLITYFSHLSFWCAFILLTINWVFFISHHLRSSPLFFSFLPTHLSAWMCINSGRLVGFWFQISHRCHSLMCRPRFVNGSLVMAWANMHIHTQTNILTYIGKETNNIITIECEWTTTKRELYNRMLYQTSKWMEKW